MSEPVKVLLFNQTFSYVCNTLNTYLFQLSHIYIYESVLNGKMQIGNTEQTH